jgi:hypothetical protein
LRAGPASGVVIVAARGGEQGQRGAGGEYSQRSHGELLVQSRISRTLAFGLGDVFAGDVVDDATDDVLVDDWAVG